MDINAKRLALKRARLEQARKERPPVPEQETIGDTLKSAGQSFVEGVNDYATAASNAVPFSGLMDKAASATYAGAQEVGDLFRDEEDQKTFSERYDADQLARKQALAEAQQRSPVASTAGTLAGGATGVAVPMPFAQTSGLAGAAGRVGAQTGMAALDVGTSGDKLFSPEAARQAATVAGGLQAGAEALIPAGKAVAPMLSKLGDTVGDKLGEVAERRAVKAATGNNQRAYDVMERKGIVNKLGRDLLDEKVVTGNKASSIADRSSTKQKEFGQKIGDLLQSVDDSGKAVVDGRSIAEQIREYVASKRAPIGKGVKQGLLDQADEFETKGLIPLTEAQTIKGEYKWSADNPNTMSLGKKSTNKVSAILSKELEDAVDRAAANVGHSSLSQEATQTGSGAVSSVPITGPNQSTLKDAYLVPELGNDYRNAKSKYESFATAAENAKKLANRQEKNRTVSLTDYLVGSAGAGIGAYSSEDKLQGALQGAAFGLGNKMLRERGSSVAAVALDKASRAAMRAPKAYSRFVDILQNAMQRGSGSFATTHEMLLHDPDYRRLMEQEE
jgi:hypothetical protein